MRALPGASALHTSYDVGDGNAGPFYARLGFCETGTLNDGEVELALALLGALTLTLSHRERE